MRDFKVLLQMHVHEMKSSLPVIVLFDFLHQTAVCYFGSLCDSAVTTSNNLSSSFGKRILY